MKNQLLVPFIASIVIGLAATSSMIGVVVIKQNNYSNLDDEFNELSVQFSELLENYTLIMEDTSDLESEYDQLLDDYNNLSGSYQALEALYITLLDNYNELLETLETFYDYIGQLILPVQYSVFAEAVRRYYIPSYLGGKTGKTYWKAFVEYCRDVVLHDSEQENSFQTVSNAFTNCLAYEEDTSFLASYIMSNTFYDWLPNWNGHDLSGSELTDIDTVHQWCIDEIEYEYDSDITVGQEDFIYDYIKFPVETAFRTLGDCEDQALLDAAYLESCGFDTAIAILHDPAHPVYGSFYHGTLLVHIENTAAFSSAYPSCTLWRLGYNDPYYTDGYTWCWLDPTWDTPFGSIPGWLQGYLDNDGISFDFCSIAFCDSDGAIL